MHLLQAKGGSSNLPGSPVIFTGVLGFKELTLQSFFFAHMPDLHFIQQFYCVKVLGLGTK